MKKILLKFKAIPIGIGVVIFNCILPTISLAQSNPFTKLYDVGGPGTPILFSDVNGTFLYGMTGRQVGTGDPDCTGCGSIFKIHTDGTGYTDVHGFVGRYPNGGAGDGANPYGSLASDGTLIWGMTYHGGEYNFIEYTNYGTVFSIDPSYGYPSYGYSYANAFVPSNTTGTHPYGSFIFVGGYRYGMTSANGGGNKGTIFSNTTPPVLHTFLGGTSDGANPHGDLVYDGSTYLYGMTPGGGTNGYGTVFRIQPNGSNYLIIHNFSSTQGAPNGSLIFVGGDLYGMTTGDGGTTSYGNIFKITTGGTYTNLYALPNTGGIGNSPYGSLIFHKTFLFGMTQFGGANGVGTLFKIDLNGANPVALVDFGGTKGSSPQGSLCSDGTYLYGMTPAGSSGNGTTFKYNYCSTAPLTVTNATYNNSFPNVYPTITFSSGISATASPLQAFKYANTATINGPFSSSTYTLSITPTPCP